MFVQVFQQDDGVSEADGPLQEHGVQAGLTESNIALHQSGTDRYC